MVQELGASLGVLEASSEPQLFCDLEGVNLWRKGSISLMQLMCRLTRWCIWWTCMCCSEMRLKMVACETYFRTRTLSTRFMMFRNDNDALFNLFGVFAAGVVDLQLMELAVRSAGDRTFVYRLARGEQTPIVCYSMTCAFMDLLSVTWGVCEKDGCVVTARLHEYINELVPLMQWWSSLCACSKVLLAYMCDTSSSILVKLCM